MDVIHGLMAYLDESVSCYHAAAGLASLLEAAGYERLLESERWDLQVGGKYFVTRGDASVLAFRLPRRDFRGFMMAAAHSDSPALKLRRWAGTPSAGGTLRLSVEPYGGMILRSWLDRPLGIAGRVMTEEADGTIRTRLVDFGRDMAVIPSVAIHMDRGVNQGRALDPAVDMLPLFGLGEDASAFDACLARELGTAPEAVLATDLYLYPRQKSTRFGMEEELIASPRLDDLQCAYACARGFLDAEDGESVPVLAVFHNEEVGSASLQGADSTFLQDTLRRISDAAGKDGEAHRAALADSFLVSADNAHAIHPAHPEYADKNEHPVLGGGIAIKHSANQKYTTDAVSEAVFTRLCRMAGVKTQHYSNRADLPGGSTLGNISTTHVSVHAVDIGLPQLAMHACSEVAAVRDAEDLASVMGLYFARSFRRTEQGAEV